MLNCSPENSDIRAFISIGAFAGLRTSEIMRLTWDKVHLDSQEIVLNARDTKTSQRRVIKISDNLAVWLGTCTGLMLKGGSITQKNFRRRLEAWRDTNGVKWIENGLRHSGASYHLAKFKNANLTAELMGHSVAVLKKHYAGLVREKDALQYFDIKPMKSDDIIQAKDILKSKIA